MTERLLFMFCQRSQDELEKIVNDCRDKLYEDKRKAREAASASSASAVNTASITEQVKGNDTQNQANVLLSHL